MSRGRSIAMVAATLLVVSPACAGQGRQAGNPSPSPAPCRVLYSAPLGYLPTDVVLRPVARGGGVRESFADDHGHELHLTSGIEGEFGEGAPLSGTVEVAVGATGTLYGREDSWVLVWRLGQARCVTQTVGASGLDRDAFMKVLRRMNVTASDREA